MSNCAAPAAHEDNWVPAMALHEGRWVPRVDFSGAYEKDGLFGLSYRICWQCLILATDCLARQPPLVLCHPNTTTPIGFDPPKNWIEQNKEDRKDAKEGRSKWYLVKWTQCIECIEDPPTACSHGYILILYHNGSQDSTFVDAYRDGVVYGPNAPQVRLEEERHTWSKEMRDRVIRLRMERMEQEEARIRKRVREGLRMDEFAPGEIEANDEFVFHDFCKQGPAGVFTVVEPSPIPLEDGIHGIGREKSQVLELSDFYTDLEYLKELSDKDNVCLIKDERESAGQHKASGVA
ncbi:hypothetical protein I316_05934 [Kwoniella heveanensis BCC8398]|uniref:Uncharacterized protein n=1 Tax=Kwoniella heveanensis BCC8398 TaxID=1296120 RepID=A0A1B9GNE5_9TREE|nr:hypothetical protein I316_05934 [Kwoniella heveanensis BCC8398]